MKNYYFRPEKKNDRDLLDNYKKLGVLEEGASVYYISGDENKVDDYVKAGDITQEEAEDIKKEIKRDRDNNQITYIKDFRKIEIENRSRLFVFDSYIFQRANNMDYFINLLEYFCKEKEIDIIIYDLKNKREKYKILHGDVSEMYINGIKLLKECIAGVDSRIRRQKKNLEESKQEYEKTIASLDSLFKEKECSVSELDQVIAERQDELDECEAILSGRKKECEIKQKKQNNMKTIRNQRSYLSKKNPNALKAGRRPANPDKVRAALALINVCNYSYEDAADAVGISVSTIRRKKEAQKSDMEN